MSLTLSNQHNLRKGLPALSYGIAGIIALGEFFLGLEVSDSLFNLLVLMTSGSTAGGLIAKGVEIRQKTREIVKKNETQ